VKVKYRKLTGNATSLRLGLDSTTLQPRSGHVAWYYDPFNALASDDDDDVEELLEPKQLRQAMDEFQQTEKVAEFWTKLEGYPGLQKRAYRILVPFPTTYLCESGFSAMAVVKTKARNRLDLRVALSVTKPNIKQIVSSQQEQESH